MNRINSPISSGSLTPKQLWILVRANLRFCFLLGAAAAFIVFVLGLFEVPYYTSVSKVQFKASDTGKTLMATILNESDSLGIKEFMDRSINVLHSDFFHEELAAIIKSGPEHERLALAWGIGFRLRLQYALTRLGYGEILYEKIKLFDLSKEEIAALLGKMINANPDYKMQTADILITALEPNTAEKINSLVVRAIIKTNEKIKDAEIGKSIDFLVKQRDATRRKLAEANDNLRAFYQDNPDLAGVGNRSNAIDEKSELLTQKERLTEEIRANKKLLGFYKKKYMDFSKDSDSTAEVFNKFKQELIELKYKRKKYLFQGYDEKNDGIVALDSKIAELEKVLSSSSMAGTFDKRLVSVGHDQNLSEKIMEIQDTIKKEEFELESLTNRVGKLSPKTNALSQSLLLLDNLKIDIRLNTDLFEDLTKKLEYAQMRRNSEDQQILLKESPTRPIRSNSTPLLLRVFFAFVVGVALSVSWLVLGMMFSAKIMDWQNVEDLGINFVGILHDHDPDLTEILMNLDCLDRPEAMETPVILCTSPNASVTHLELALLTDYLARQGEKSLMIVVGNTAIQRGFQLTSDIGFAKVYTHRNDKEFILQISDRDTIKSLRDSITILESTYELRYACVFLYFVDGINDPNYHTGLKVSTKVLLMGQAAKYTSSDYHKLIQGTKNLNGTNFAFVEFRRSHKRAIQSIRKSAQNSQFDPPVFDQSFGKKVKDVFFDL